MDLAHQTSPRVSPRPLRSQRDRVALRPPRAMALAKQACFVTQNSNSDHSLLPSLRMMSIVKNLNIGVAIANTTTEYLAPVIMPDLDILETRGHVQESLAYHPKHLFFIIVLRLSRPFPNPKYLRFRSRSHLVAFPPLKRALLKLLMLLNSPLKGLLQY